MHVPRNVIFRILAASIQTGSQNAIKKAIAIVMRLLVCVKYVKGMHYLCVLFRMGEVNASNFQTSELHALSIE